MNRVAGGRILVVEDNPDVHELILATLTWEGHRVVGIPDGPVPSTGGSGT